MQIDAVEMSWNSWWALLERARTADLIYSELKYVEYLFKCAKFSDTKIRLDFTEKAGQTTYH